MPLSLLGQAKEGKVRIMPRVSEKICSVLKRPERQMELFDDEA
jgi:hypothetical protein